MCITISIVLEKLRLFLVVLEEGSLRRAADRLRISQSAITRQMQSLELDLGGRVLERTSAGVRPTNGEHALAERAKTLLADYDSTMAEVRRLNRGESERLRISYIASAVQEYLGPALAVLRRAYPRLKVKMLDQTPGEMITALRQGKIDLALTLHGIDLLSRDFYARKLATVRSLVALSVSHRFATERQVSLSQLRAKCSCGDRTMWCRDTPRGPFSSAASMAASVPAWPPLAKQLVLWNLSPWQRMKKRFRFNQPSFLT